jgi:hypothetical protein
MMKVIGLPERFWVVTTPTTVSTVGDICFSCTFEQFALQVRGGLHEENIVGMYADEEEATATAKRLLARFKD